MPRPIAIAGPPSSIGIRPYDDGTPRRLDLVPAALRDPGLVARLGARDDGDVLPPPYRQYTRPPGAVRNEREVGGRPADRVAAADHRRGELKWNEGHHTGDAPRP
jgi:hypothetical protein